MQRTDMMVIDPGDPEEDFPLDERALIDRARVDSAAFAQLYRRYVDRVFRYLRTYTENDDDAADLTQHVFLRALEALPGYRNEGAPFGGWLFRIARNAATDAFRRRRRVLPWDHVPPELHPLSANDPEAASLQREALNQVRVLVSQLDPEKWERL